MKEDSRVNRFFQSLTGKKFKYGAFSTLTAVFVIAILVVVNLVVGQLNITKDLTPDQLYSLTDDTKTILSDLTEDVTLYALYETGQENALYKRIMDEYAASSPHVKVVYRDPYLYPQFVEQFAKDGETIAVNSVIVESAKRHKVIQANEMYTTQFDSTTFQSTLQSIDIEPQVTNAINYVLEEQTAVIYVVSNHDEQSIPDTLKKQISLANYDVRDLDLLSVPSIPEDCSILFISTPSKDWLAEEAQVVSDFLKDDGRAMFLIDYTMTVYPNLQGVLETYGAQLGDYLIVEGNANNYYSNNPVWLLPSMAQHDITNDFISKNYRVFLPCDYVGVRGVETMSLKKNSTTIEPLLYTSSAAFGKANPDAQTINKESGDVDGPFNIAVAIKDSYYTDVQHDTKLVVVGSTYLLDSRIGDTNYEFIINAANWLQDKQDTIYIRPKTMSNTSLSMDQGQAITIMVFSVIVLPAVIIGTGLFVWLRRRHS